jgi:hypothetical protein
MSKSPMIHHAKLSASLSLYLGLSPSFIWHGAYPRDPCESTVYFDIYNCPVIVSELGTTGANASHK